MLHPKSQTSATMCNAATIKVNSSAKLSGPATEALEQQASKKRRLSYPLDEESPASNALSFEFDSMFIAVSSSDGEAFPSIGWDFDDDEDDGSVSDEKVQEPLFEQTRVYGSGMLRSKSLKRDLSSLDVDCLNRGLSLASIDKIPLNPFNSCCKANRTPIFSKISVSASLRSL
jgi:hypothetical protein